MSLAKRCQMAGQSAGAAGTMRNSCRDEVAPGSPESLAQSMFPQGFPRNPGELPISSHTGEVHDHKGDRRGYGYMAERSYDPIVPMKVGIREKNSAVREAIFGYSCVSEPEWDVHG